MVDSIEFLQNSVTRNFHSIKLQICESIIDFLISYLFIYSKSTRELK